MSVQTYCSTDDVKAIIGEAAYNACLDDDQDGVLSGTESGYATSAIERAAVELNSSLRHQYVLSQLATNEWCKWANAELAAFYLRSRRNNPVEQSHADAVVQIRTELLEMRWGRQQLPQQSPSFEHIPTVSNFTPEIGKYVNPIRVVREESTGVDPVGGRKRNVANLGGFSN